MPYQAATSRSLSAGPPPLTALLPWTNANFALARRSAAMTSGSAMITRLFSRNDGIELAQPRTGAPMSCEPAPGAAGDWVDGVLSPALILSPHGVLGLVPG